MRKSIYYLIANTVSIIAAFIFISCIKTNAYPIFGFDLIVSDLKSAFEPFKYFLVVEALSIVFCTQDLVSASNKKDGKVPFALLKNVIAGVVTIGSIFYTWIAVILTLENYRIGSEISIPFFFMGAFVLGIVCIYLSSFVSKKNATIGSWLVPTGLLAIVTGLVYQCVPELYIIIPGACLTALAIVIPTIVSLKKVKTNN